MDSKEKSIAALHSVICAYETSGTDTSSGSLQDIISTALCEKDKKERKKMLRDFSARHSEVLDYVLNNEELVNSEAEAALISAAVGGVVTEKKVFYKGGRRQETISQRHIPPNMAALSLLLKNRMPEKYSDKQLEDKPTTISEQPLLYKALESDDE